MAGQAEQTTVSESLWHHFKPVIQTGETVMDQLFRRVSEYSSSRGWSHMGLGLGVITLGSGGEAAAELG